MSNITDFVIKNGVLKKYKGPGGDVVIPDGVTIIGRSAFEYCSRLKSIVIPDSVTSIGDSAFSECENLKSVVVPDSVTEIGKRAFYGCEKLADTKGFVIVRNVLLGYYGPGGDVVIPDGVTRIGDSAFYGCESLKSVVIPDGVTNIGDGAFSSCTSLTSVVIPDSMSSIGDSAFEDCESLKSIVIPNSVTEIGECAFNGCGKLADAKGFVIVRNVLFGYTGTGGDVVIPDGVTSIGDYAFAYCESLKSIVIPDSVTSIGDYAFGYDVLNLEFILAPSISISDLDEIKLGAQAGYGFLSAPERFIDHVIYEQYRKHCLSKKKGILNIIFKRDDEKALSFYIREKKVTLKNFEAAYLVPAKFANAERCLAALLEWKNSQESAKPTKASKAAKPEKAAKPNTTLEEEYEKKYAAILGDSLLKWMKLDEKVLPEVLLKDGTKAPEVLFKYILVSYGSIDPASPRIVPEADAAAELLRRDSFCDALAALIPGNLDRLAHPALIPVLCRFGNAKQIKAMIAAHWSTFTAMLMLSETREAVIWLEKNTYGGLAEYARLRGISEDEVREKYLFDFGFDENGVRLFELGNTVLEVRLQNDLKLAMFDTKKQKAVTSVPKTGADPNLYQLAKDEIADMRANIKKAYTIKKWQLFDDYINSTAASHDQWTEIYLKNPFLHVLAELLIWQQGDQTFTCTADGLTLADGTAYKLTKKPITLAHPMELDKADVAAWQHYFTAKGLKQPFEQVWEPVREASQIKPDRYAGIPIPVKFLKRAEHRGIRCEWYFVNYYSQNHYLFIDGFEVGAEETDDPDELVIESIEPRTWNRRTNMVISYLDRLTVYGRISKDDLTVMDVVDSFTLAQITEFIKTAQESNASNLTAALLEYKNNTYPDFDPMAEFTLDW